SGGYVAYYESSTVDGGISQVPAVGVELTSPSGHRLRLSTLYGNRSDGRLRILSYTSGAHHGVALYQFHIDEPGTYEVTLTPNRLDAPDAVIAFGPSIGSSLAVGGAILVAGVVLALAGLITLIVGLVVRRRHKKRLPPPGWGYPAAWPAAGPPLPY